ncbi:unnamed protein product [Caenorhabditis angaria]|uniref:Uncharacterized protein n=1 Tax=Caenorhabditis angaria TaxID=860376 RepID=A0A9P1N955_9PELO|nr:unnamed protein product [Caenorhabditis angaria]
MSTGNPSLFSVEIATREEILNQMYSTKDINAIWVFTFNSDRDTSWFEIVIIYVLLIISFIFTLIGIKCSKQSTFPHINHRCIYIFALIAWCELIISRSLVIYFQLTKNENQSHYQSLFWAAVFRYHYLFFGAQIIFCVVFERIMATCYMRDYEKNKRLWIFWLVIFLTTISSLIYSMLTIYEFIQMRFILFYGISFTFPAILILEFLYYFNKSKLNALDKNDKTVQYSLSIRYQIQENVRSIKLIRGLVITVGFFIIAVIFGECLPIIMKFDEDYLHICNIIFDTMVHINPILVVPLSFICFVDYKKAFIRNYRRQFRVTNDYQIIIIIQSFFILIANFAEVLLNEIQTIDRYIVKIGHPVHPYSDNQRIIVSVFAVVSSFMVEDILALFNLHRLVMFTKPQKIKRLYLVYIPISLSSCLVNIATMFSDIKSGYSIDLYFKNSQLGFLTIVIIYCYVKLKRYFSKNVSMSEKTKQLQRKLSISILLQLLILLFIAIVAIFLPSLIILIRPEIDSTSFYLIHSIIAVILIQWCSVLSSLLILWSIIGFIKPHNFTAPKRSSFLVDKNYQPNTNDKKLDVKVLQINTQFMS